MRCERVVSLSHFARASTTPPPLLTPTQTHNPFGSMSIPCVHSSISCLRFLRWPPLLTNEPERLCWRIVGGWVPPPDPTKMAASRVTCALHPGLHVCKIIIQFIHNLLSLEPTIRQPIRHRASLGFGSVGYFRPLARFHPFFFCLVFTRHFLPASWCPLFSIYFAFTSSFTTDWLGMVIPWVAGCALFLTYRFAVVVCRWCDATRHPKKDHITTNANWKQIPSYPSWGRGRMGILIFQQQQQQQRRNGRCCTILCCTSSCCLFSAHVLHWHSFAFALS